MRQTVLLGWVLALAVPASQGAAQTGAAPATEPSPAATAPGAMGPAATEPAGPGSDLLGAAFQSRAWCVAFRGPGGCKAIKSPGGDEIVRFVNGSEDWQLDVSHLEFPEPMPLTAAGGRASQPGLMESVVQKMVTSTQGVAQVIKQDTFYRGDYNVGLIVIRYPSGGKSRLCQVALVQANDQLYYVFNFTTPGGHDAGDDYEKRVVGTFNAVLDTVRLLDRTQLVEDQRRRVLHTRALFLDWTDKKLTKVLVKQQWFRVLHDNHDVGWTYVEEMTGVDRRKLVGTIKAGTANEKVGPDDLVTDNGLVVYVRSWAQTPQEATIDTGSEMFVTYDRSLEVFANMLGVTPKGKPTNLTVEIGQSLRQIKREFHLKDPEKMGVPDEEDPKEPVNRLVEVRQLKIDVTKNTSGDALPLSIDVPPWYLPEAMGYLLPRLLPIADFTREPKSYLFASYVADNRKVMMRYVDVGTERQVTLGGKTFQATPVEDRIGIEGVPTVHYVDDDGRYVGSESKDAGVTVVLSDPDELSRIWPKAQFTRPEQVAAPPRLKPSVRQDDLGRAVNAGGPALCR